MKDSFPEYYASSEEELAEIWRECLFVFDANVLLNLYRYSADTRAHLLEVLGKLESRLWVPHQAALEYQKQRLNVIVDQIDAWQRFRRSLEDQKTELRKTTADQRVPHHIRESQDMIEALQVSIDDIIDKTIPRSEDCEQLLKEDGIRAQIDTLFHGKVGKPFPRERIDEIEEQGKVRYAKRKPPGYKDQDKRGGNIYGDLIIWFQMMEKAKEVSRPILFTTDDSKEDWWIKPRQDPLGPRPELVHEMRASANVPFHMYLSDAFLSRAEVYLKMQIEEAVLSEVRETRRLAEVLDPLAIARRLSRTRNEIAVVLRQLQDMLSSIQQEVRMVEGVELGALGSGWARLQSSFEATIQAVSALEVASQVPYSQGMTVWLTNEMNRLSDEVLFAFHELSRQVPLGSSQLEIATRYEAYYHDIHNRSRRAGFHSVGMAYPPDL